MYYAALARLARSVEATSPYLLRPEVVWSVIAVFVASLFFPARWVSYILVAALIGLFVLWLARRTMERPDGSF